jgi:hypothetical protein
MIQGEGWRGGVFFLKTSAAHTFSDPSIFVGKKSLNGRKLVSDPLHKISF